MKNPQVAVGDRTLEVAVQSATSTPAPRVEYVETPVDAGEEPDEGLNYWEILRRRKGTVLLVTFVCGLTALLFSLPQTPVYQARALLEIQGLNENFLSMRDLDPTASTGSYSADSYLQTQVKVLRSQSLLERVVGKLKLDEWPEFAARRDRLSAWRRALGVPEAAPLPPKERALAAAERNLLVRASPLTRLVEVLYDSPDPQLAAQFVDTLVQEFIDQNLEARWSTTQRTGEWLTRQLDDLKIKLEKSEDEMQTYARNSGLMFTAETDSVAEQKLQQLQEELSKAQANRVTKQSQYEIAKSSPAESLPEVLDNGPLRDYQVKLSDLRRELAELSSAFTPAYYKVKRVQAQVAELETTLQKERGNIIVRIRNEYESAERREKLLAAAYAAQAKLVSEQSGRAIHYRILKREVDTNRQLYESMLQKVKEAGIASAMRASNIRVVDTPKPPSRPYKPDLPLNGGVGLLTGLFGGVALVIVRERADRTLRAPGDAPACLKIPELGVIPLRSVDSSRRTYGARAARALRNLRQKGGVDRVELVTWQHKPSLLAESFRATLTSILFSRPAGNRPQVLVLSSASPLDGKTTVVSNLGIALAEIRQKVLLIDADLRRPRLHDVFNVTNSWGLSDLLQERHLLDHCPREALARETGIPGLYLLPAGPGTAGIANLLHSDRMLELLRRFRQEFDVVLIDTPPMLHLSDARVLGRMADAAILVFRAGQTARSTALAARQRFAEDGTQVLGTVLNGWNPATSGYGYYGSYKNYYYNKS
ncbi:MAG: polysaccharide biosynthesis tyrosine autokinase [Acidobacteria bacterium]|nr:polysaccharide biosynthesis tyrosine autokinase [Acidobacteriota bacterium]